MIAMQAARSTTPTTSVLVLRASGLTTRPMSYNADKDDDDDDEDQQQVERSGLGTAKYTYKHRYIIFVVATA